MRSPLLPIFKLCLILACFASLTACGIKPGQLDYPGEGGYPRTYPDPESVR